jgi:hypothetical protein
MDPVEEQGGYPPDESGTDERGELVDESIWRSKAACRIRALSS